MIAGKILTVFSFLLININPVANRNIAAHEMVCGHWENEEKNLRIQVYMQDEDYKAKITWFGNTEGKPMNYWKDVHNPDPVLRKRTILGMSILNGLKFNQKTGTWEDGEVYDSQHGKTWNASAKIDEKGLLRVRGYWKFKMFGKTMSFHRYN